MWCHESWCSARDRRRRRSVHNQTLWLRVEWSTQDLWNRNWEATCIHQEAPDPADACINMVVDINEPVGSQVSEPPMLEIRLGTRVHRTKLAIVDDALVVVSGKRLEMATAFGPFRGEWGGS